MRKGNWCHFFLPASRREPVNEESLRSDAICGGCYVYDYSLILFVAADGTIA